MSPEESQKLGEVFDAALDTIETALQVEQTLQDKNAALVKQLADAEQVYLEKVAAATKAATLDSARVEQALNRLVMLNILPFTAQTKAAAQIAKDPNSVLTLLTQVAETLTAAPSEGYGIHKSASENDTVSDSDPDGWDLVRQGHVPTVRP